MSGEGVPPAVAVLVEDGEPEQEPIEWEAERWVERLGRHESLLHRLPNPISRQDVFDLNEALHKFIGSMIWGFGRRGYGSWRVSQMLGTEHTTTAIDTTQELLRTEGAEPAYTYLATEGRLPWLGPVFGTKYLYFAGYHEPVDAPAPLILDDRVAFWLAENTCLQLDPMNWEPRVYEHYIKTVGTWAEELRVEPDMIEKAIFLSE